MKFKEYLRVDEMSLSRPNFRDNPERFDIFKQKILKGDAFELVGGGSIVLHKSNLKELSHNPMEMPSVFKSSTGETIKLSDLQKNAEFGSSGGSGAGAATTKTVECAQCVYLAMVANGLTPNTDNVMKVRRYIDIDEKLSVIQAMSPDWVHSSIQGANSILKNLPFAGKMKYHRGSKSIQLIEDTFKRLNSLAGRPFSNINKFTPADIWLISDSVNLSSDLKNINTLETLRLYFLKQFHAGLVVGISLKKIVSDTPPWKIYNNGNERTAKYTGIEFTKSKFLQDAKDVYVHFDYQGKGKIQFRNFGGKTLTGWQGEVKGKNANAGKIGGGIVSKILKRFTGYELTESKVVVKYINNKDTRFLKKFFGYAEELYGSMSYSQFLKDIETTEDSYMYSKYLGLELLHYLNRTSTQKRNQVINDIVGYAASATSQSAIFVKLGS